MYNRALSANEVQLLYYSNLNKYDTDKWLFTDYKQCTLLDGSHSFTGYSSDTAGNTQSIQRSITTTIPNYNSLAPNGFALGSTSVTKVGNTLSGQFDDYFEFVDRKGNTGWTTTIQLPLEMRGQKYGFTISGTNVYFKAAGIDTIQGISTSNVYVTGSLSSYNSFGGARTYIMRDQAGFTCPAGIYGNKPWLKVDVPSRQSPDTYTGTITFDIVQ